jgi:UDP-N-acetylglucosamine:LPS N-acetylglucosamine transferase
VASDVAAETLLRLGVGPSRVAQLGIPIRRQFSDMDRSAREVRATLGLDLDAPVVVLMGGGDGAGRIADTARAIGALADQGLPPFQLVVLTGRNRRAREALAAHTWPAPVSATVHGTIQNVAEYMTAADVVVTKPGSLTLSEALAMARPLVVGRPIPGQEEGNVRYVVESGAGLHFRNPEEGAGAVAYLLRDPSARWEMGQRAMRMSKPHATERTVDTLQGLILNAQKGA